MRFLFLTDTHIKGASPKNRKDNLLETVIKKLNEVKDIVREEGIDFILHGGDWFDRPDVSPSIVGQIVRILISMDTEIYTVAGNHDLFGHNSETISRSMLGLIDSTGIIKLLKRNEPVKIEKRGITVSITGQSYHHDIDGENYRDYYCIKKADGVDYAIHMVHGMLLEKPFAHGFKCTRIDQIIETEADITFCGHYHTGFGIKQIEDRYIVNPGSLVRVSNNISEIRRKPKVVIVELGENISVKERELRTALPGEEVLDRDELVASQQRELKLYQFFQDIEAASDFSKVDFYDIIDEIITSEDISIDIRDEAIRRISEAEVELGGFYE